MALSELAAGCRIYVDTNVWIYALEGFPETRRSLGALFARVDAGEYDLAISLAPVTMDQFCAVCEQNKFMPPKSTWFDPKIRSGLVMAILD